MGSIHSFGRILIVILILLCISNFVYAQTQGMVTDSSTAFLQGDPAGATIASTASTIDFGIVDVGSAEGRFTHWCNIVLGPDGLYYFAVGDHMEVVMLMSYDPSSKKQKLCIDSRNITGLIECKWHGRPVINPDNGDMYLIGFCYGDIVYYNIYSKQIEDLGQPVPGHGFREHIWDWQRDRLYGIGGMGDILVYDTYNHTVVFHGNPVDSQTGKEYNWEERSRLLDRETGFLYGSDMNDNTILRYDPSNNSFHAMQSSLQSSLRACSNVKEEDGSFWIFDRSGNVFKFFPEQDRLEPHGPNWDSGGYATFIERSPGGRYLYYCFAVGSSDIPIVQYDTQTGIKKVIAFLGKYYSDKYGYEPFQFYGGALSQDGSSLFMVCNGSPDNPGMFHVHIPESERSGDPQSGVPTCQSKYPADFVLEQNYPNPFNPSTTIQYRLKKRGFVTLSLYDVNGREIDRLVNGQKEPGLYKIIVDVKNLPSGLYYYRLMTNGQDETKKMMVIK